LIRIFLVICILWSTKGVGEQVITLPPVPRNAEEAKDYAKKMSRKILPKLREINQCVASTELFLSEYNDYKNLLLGDTTKGRPLMLAHPEKYKADVSLRRNLKYLREIQSEFSGEMKEFIQQFKDGKDKRPEERLKHLDQGIQAISKKVGMIVELEDIFLGSIDTLISFFEEIAPDKSALPRIMGSEKCAEYKMDTVLAFLYEDSRKTLLSVSKMVALVKEGQVKRHRLVSLVIGATKASLANDIANGQAEELNQLRDAIDRFWRWDSLHSQWFDFIARNRPNGSWAGGLDRYYFEYRRPLRLLRVLSLEAKEFRQKVEKIEAPGNLKPSLLRKIDVAVETIDSRLEALESKGWQGQLENQRAFVDAYLDMGGAHFSSNCLDFLKAHKKLEVETEAGFSKAEKAYFFIVNECVVQ
jgi:hypothetical protein